LLKRVLPFFASAFLLFPLAHAAALLGRAQVWSVLGVILVVRSIGGMSIVTGTLCINNIAPNRASLGRVNGLAQSLGSLARAIGPIGSSSLFAFSIEHPDLLGGQLVWYTLFAIAALTWLLSLRIRDANKARWRKEKRVLAAPAPMAADGEAAPAEVFTTMLLSAAATPAATLGSLLPPQLCAMLHEASPRTQGDVVSTHVLARRIPLLREHLRRLSTAVAALHAAAPSAWQTPASYAALSDERLLQALHEALDGQTEARRVRLALSREGVVAVQHYALSQVPRSPSVRLDVEATRPRTGTLDDVVLRHKTSARGNYDEARSRVHATLGAPAAMGGQAACFDVLLWLEESGERLLTESSIASVLLQLAPSSSSSAAGEAEERPAARFVTPPRRLPLLPGVVRSELLRRGAVREEEISVARLKSELQGGGRLWLVNALRGAFEVHLIP
jgi:branched-subunit amino acid aminotransferase/4-amino-4-deoxychorismate lyase